MANEIRANYDSGVTLYAVIRNHAGQVWHVDQAAFEAWGAADHAAADYDIPLVDTGGSLHVGDFDTAIPAGRYAVQVFVQAGAAAADTDSLIDSREMVWSGRAEVTATKVVSNKAIHDKASGVISYYDDDGTTVMLTHTMRDEASALTRDPN